MSTFEKLIRFITQLKENQLESLSTFLGLDCNDAIAVPTESIAEYIDRVCTETREKHVNDRAVHRFCEAVPRTILWDDPEEARLQYIKRFNLVMLGELRGDGMAVRRAFVFDDNDKAVGLSDDTLALYYDPTQVEPTEADVKRNFDIWFKGHLSDVLSGVGQQWDEYYERLKEREGQ